MSEGSTEASTAEGTEATAPETASTDTEQQQPESAAEVAKWKALAQKHEQRAKANAEKAKGYDELKASQMTEQEKAVETARAEARAEAIREAAPRLVAAEFRIAAAGRLTAEQVAELTEDLDLTKYLTDSGEVDTERVAKKVNALAPEERKPAPSFGGGPRKSADKPEPSPGLGRLRDAYASTTPK